MQYAYIFCVAKWPTRSNQANENENNVQRRQQIEGKKTICRQSNTKAIDVTNLTGKFILGFKLDFVGNKGIITLKLSLYLIPKWN